MRIDTNDERNHGLSRRLDLMVSDGWLLKLDDWRFANRVQSRAEAIRNLIEIGIEAEKGKGPAGSAIPPSHDHDKPMQGNAND